ncbi:MAG: protein kinaselike protein, partial [Paenibacillus sp.]|nr:protein kinaselike protein [Paenibacillus sp.]
GYLGNEFEWFYKQYSRQAQRTVTLNSDLLRFYSYRHHLRNLTNWITNILYRNTDEGQNANDLEMIEFHCIERWKSIEPGIKSTEQVMRN